MGSYNVVVVPEACPACGAQVERRVQFAWGDTWLHEYRLGDRLAWGGNDRGEPGLRRVVVEAAAEDCPACGAEGPEGEVVVERDVLVAWRPEGFTPHLAGTVRWLPAAARGLAGPPRGGFLRATVAADPAGEHLSVVLRLAGPGDGPVEIAYLAPELADLDPAPGTRLLLCAGRLPVAELGDLRPAP